MRLRVPVAHPLRWFIPGLVYEFTTSTIQNRFLLRPGGNTRELILGVLARALALYPAVSLHAFAFLSNHYHLMASSTDGAQLASWIGYVNSNIARELGRVHGWRGPFWGRRTRPIPIVDEDALVARLRYILSQGVKEGLVERPEQWPGATSTPWLLGGRMQGLWIDRDLETRALRAGRASDTQHYTATYELELSPLPCWARLSRAEIAARVKSLIEEVVAETRSTRSTPPLGAAAVLRQDPHEAPVESSSRPAPVCHAATAKVRAAFRAAYDAFTAAFRKAAEVVRRGVDPSRADFPPGSFPRPASFIHPPATFRPPWTDGYA